MIGRLPLPGLWITLILLAAAPAGGQDVSKPSSPAGPIRLAVMEAEVVNSQATADRKTLAGTIDTILAASLAEQPGFELVDRQSLDKVLTEKKVELAGVARVTPEDVAEGLRSFWSAGVLVCPTITVNEKLGQAVVTIQAVIAQRGTLLAEAIVAGELAGNGWKDPALLDKPLARLWTDLRAATASNLRLPSLEVAHITLGDKVERLQWMADDLTDALAFTPYAGVILLKPRQAVHTKEERLLRLMGLSGPAASDGVAKLSAASDFALTGELTEQTLAGATFDKTPLTLALRLHRGGKELAATKLTGQVGTYAKLQEQACTWLAQALSPAVEAPAQPLDESHAQAAVQQQLAIARRLAPIHYSQGAMEADRMERLAAAALRACHLDPTNEEAAYLAVTTIEGLYAVRGQSSTLACKDRILQLGQQYLDRFGDKVASHHQKVLSTCGSAGHSAAWLIRGKPGGTGAISQPPDERQYLYARAYVRAWMEVGIRGETDEHYNQSNSLSAAPMHLLMHLIPNIPDDKLDQEYAFWRELWRTWVTPFGPEKSCPWELIDVAFQARRKDPAAVRIQLQRLADHYPTHHATWRLLRDEVIPLYLRAAGDEQWQTWRPTWPKIGEIVVTNASRTRFYQQFETRPMEPWAFEQFKTLPLTEKIVFPQEVLDRGHREGMGVPYPRIQPLFVVGGEMWLITPGLWNSLNTRISHSLFTVPLMDLQGKGPDLTPAVQPLAWPEPIPKDKILVTCWHVANEGREVFLGTLGHGMARFIKTESEWRGSWINSQQGLPTGSVLWIANGTDAQHLVVDVLGPEGSVTDEKGDVRGLPRKHWSANLDLAGSSVLRVEELAMHPDWWERTVELVTHHPGQNPPERRWSVVEGMEGYYAVHHRFEDQSGLAPRRWEPVEKYPLKERWHLRQLASQAGSDSVGEVAGQLIDPINDIPWAKYLALLAPIKDTTLAEACSDSLWLGSFYFPSPSERETYYLMVYRPATLTDPQWEAKDRWLGPFFLPQRAKPFALCPDGAGNLWVTTSQGIFRIHHDRVIETFAETGISTRQWREQDQARRRKADWRHQLRERIAEGNTTEAVKLVQERLDALGQIDADSTVEQQRDWAILSLSKALALFEVAESTDEVLEIYTQFAAASWVEPASRRYAWTQKLYKLSDAGRWEEFLRETEVCRPLFPSLFSADGALDDRILFAQQQLKSPAKATKTAKKFVPLNLLESSSRSDFARAAESAGPPAAAGK